MRAIFFFLILISIFFPANGIEITLDQIMQTDAGLLIGAVILFNISIITLAFIYGKSANDAHALVFSKDESYHLLFSIILLLFVVGILASFCSIFSAFFGFAFDSAGISDACSDKLDSGPVEVSTCYVSKMENDAKNLVSNSIDLSVDYEMSSMWIYSFNIPMFGTTMTPTKAYKKAYGMTFDMMNTLFATPALISLSMQKIFLKYAETISIAILLPAALLLRIFFPTRQMGNILIAVVIGIQVFLPLMYAFNGAMYENILTPEDCTSNPSYAGMIKDNLFGDCKSNVSFLSYARLLPQAFFLPNLAIAILITFLGSINKALRVIG
ncbi:MAG: hypothetical protein WC501_02875 [Candidatus Micrarchaeia archaeon]